MSIYDLSQANPANGALAINKVLKNTYMLLGLTMAFSSAMAAVATYTNAPPMHWILLLVGMYGLMFLTTALRNSAIGILSIFAFTGFMGYSLGPVLNSIINGFSNGSQIIMTSLGATGIIFFALSGYVLTTRKDFSYLNGFLFVVATTAMIGSIAGLFFQMPLLQLAISAAFVLVSSGVILMETSLIINGGERNYIMATVSLFVALFNLFISLLRIFAAFGGDRE